MVEMKQVDLSTKNIWTLYFSDPKTDSLDFTIDNHSNRENFHFEILAGKTKVYDGDVTVSNGATKIIPVSISDITNKKIIISVTIGDNKKEIYKNF
jgi:hypothetical protein